MEDFRTYSYESAEMLCFKISALVVLSLTIAFLGYMVKQKIDLKLAILLFATLSIYLVGVFLQFLYSIRLVQWDIMLSVHFGVGSFMLSHAIVNFAIKQVYTELNTNQSKAGLFFNIYLLIDTLFTIAVYGLWIGSIHSFNSDGRILASNLYVGQIAVNEFVVTTFSYFMIKSFFQDSKVSHGNLTGQGFYAFIFERILHLFDAVVMAIDIVNQTAISNFLTSMRYCFFVVFIWNVRHYFKQKYI